MPTTIISGKISQDELKQLAQESFGDMVKAVVDIEKGILAVGGELHADAEAILLQDGSEQKNLWGINLYPTKEKADIIEFSSLINIRPALGNRSILIQDEEVKNKIRKIIDEFLWT